MDVVLTRGSASCSDTPGSRKTMERYAHFTAPQQRDAADFLD
jgi:hypothetical protein